MFVSTRPLFHAACPWKLLLVGFLLPALLGCNASAPDAGKVLIRFPQALAETHPRVQAVQRFGLQLEEKTQGSIQVQVFPGGQLYGARQAVNAAAYGDVEMALEPESHFITFDDRFKAVDIPFVFEDHQGFSLFMERLENQVRGSLEERGLVLIALWDEGPMVLATRDRLLENPGDFLGMKIRSSGHELLARSWNGMGAATVSIPIHEVYTALQQGVADGIYTTLHTFVSGKIYEVSPKVVLWPSRAVYVWVANREFWYRLKESEREMILQLVSGATDYYHREIRGAYPDLVRTVRSAKDGEFRELDETQIHVFRERMGALMEGWRAEYSALLEGLD